MNRRFAEMQLPVNTLWEAAEEGDSARVGMLLSENSNPNQVSDEDDATPLISACGGEGDVEVRE